MEMQSKFEKAIGVKDKDDKGVWVRSTRTLRQLIGILGIALPFLLIAFSPNCMSTPLETISHYYYTRAGTLFIIILSLIAVFLIIYTKDFILSSIAGICALLVVFLPTSKLVDDNALCVITSIPSNPLREKMHLISASIFLLILAFMSIFKFTKSDETGEVTGNKKVFFNCLYILCGIIMLLALIVIALGFFTDVIPKDYYDDNKLTFWMESIAVVSFGISWLAKGQTSYKIYI